MTDILFGILFGGLGLIIGSFLNVCIYRIPNKTFFINSRSYCPNCGETLKWYDMFPVLSYIFLGGKCRFCKERISIRYPLIEAANMLLWLGAFLRFGISWASLLAAVLLSALLVMAMIDFDTMEIPNGLVVFIMFIALFGFIPTVQPELIWYEKLIGFFAISVPLYIIALISRGGIGGGDIKLMAAVGLFLGWKKTLLAFIFSAVLAAIGGTILMIIKKKGGKLAIPFGPYLAIGSAISLFVGDLTLSWYIGLFN